MLGLLATTGAGPAERSLEADLQGILERTLSENPNAPGICAYVESARYGLRWSGAAGTVAHGSAAALTPAHSFRIASNTKTYVAAALLRLVEMGFLNLDDPLGDHLPADQKTLLTTDGYDLNAMTVRQVLSHTSGLADHTGDERAAAAILADPQHRWTREEQIALCVTWFDPLDAPGAYYSYSDTGYIILGGIIERITGQNLAAAVRDLDAYDRLGLAHTWWEYLEEPPGATADLRAHQYYGAYDTRDWHASFDLYGGGGIVTNARELALFLRKLLQGEVFQREETLAAMTGGGTAEYRLGLMCTELAGRLAWGHQGFWNTFAFHVPTLDVTVAGSIMNHDAVNGRAVAAALIQRIAAEPRTGTLRRTTARSCQRGAAFTR